MARMRGIAAPAVRLPAAGLPRVALPACGWRLPRPASAGGGIGAAVMEALVLWYDPRRQGATNESMAADPHLKDLSGNGHDATCYNFAWTEGSGISAEAYPGAIVADGVDDLIYAEELELLTDFTVMAKREFIRFNWCSGLAYKWTPGGGNGAFIFEMNYNKDEAVQPDECWVFSNAGGGGENDITPAEGRVSWMTPASYNGQPLTRGKRTDGRRLDLFCNKGEITQTCSAALWSFILFNRTLTAEEIEWVKEHMMGQQEHNEEWYGVEFYTASSNPDCIRIGNPELHRTLPVQNMMKGCLLNDDGEVVKYLNENDWTSEVCDGSQGQVMVEMPKDSYWKFETEGNIRRVKFSTKPLPGFTKTPQGYVSAYEATVQRSTNALVSVVNTTADYRGGNNQSAWDGTYRSLLGAPAASISRTNFRAYARNREEESTEWNCMTYDMQKLLYWLFVVEYGTLNSQKSFKSDKDANGYAQGGLGNGVVNLDGAKWNNFNGYNPFIPCGYTNSLGNGNGQINYTMPFEYDANGEANYAGEYSAETAYTDGQFVSQGEELYECIADATAGTELTNTTYFTKIIRTVTNVIRYRGIENPFGHLWQWTDGINVRVSPNEPDGDGLSKVYVCSDPSKFNDTNYDGYTYVGNVVRTQAYVKEVIFGEGGEIIPSVVGGSSTTYFCDNHYTYIRETETLQGVLFGGYAAHGARAGFAYVNSANVASATFAYFGSRLCFLPNNN